jgi:hypothetical protein
LTRTRSIIAAFVLALAVPTAIAGCGSDDGDSDADPQEVIDATFNNDEQITSGVIDLSVDASAGDQGSFTASLSGPFQGVSDDPTAFPQLDLTGSVSGDAAGQSVDFEGGLVVTEDNAYVEYGGETYEVGTETFSQFKEAAEQSADQSQETDPAASFQEGCEQAIEAQGGDPSACDFDLGGWFTDLTNDGTEDVEGTESVHISGNIDVSQMLEDFAGLASAVPSAAGQVPEDQIQQAADAISEASFDLYSGADDNLLRKLDLNVAIDPSAVEGATPVPVGTVDFGLSFAFSGVNEEQTIEAPADAQPIEDLLGQFGLGGLGPLGGLEGMEGLDGSGSGLDLGGGSGAAPGAGDSQAYLECVADAGNDPAAASQCLEELQ